MAPPSGEGRCPVVRPQPPPSREWRPVLLRVAPTWVKRSPDNPSVTHHKCHNRHATGGVEHGGGTAVKRTHGVNRTPTGTHGCTPRGRRGVLRAGRIRAAVRWTGRGG